MNADQLMTLLRERGDWEPPEPGRMAALARRLGHPLPPALETLYRATGGGQLGRVAVFDLDELEDVNLLQKGYGQALPSALFFASDGADGFFFVDSGGALGRGDGAVFWMSRGGARADRCRPCAPDVATFLADVSEGKVTWSGLALGDEHVADVREILGAHPDRYAARPVNQETWEVGEAGRRVGVRIPEALAQLQGVTDGMRVERAGVTVYPAAEIAAVPGARGSDGRPDLLWFAEDDRGRRYAIATGPWRDLQAGDVVAVAPGHDPFQAPRLGPLSALLKIWLED